MSFLFSGSAAGAVSRQDFKGSVRAASTANLVLSGLQTVDGVSLIANDRILVRAQTAGAENGIYVVSAGAWSRAVDADASDELNAGSIVAVTEGTLNADKNFQLTTNDPIVIGTTAQVWAELSSYSDEQAQDAVGSILTDSSTIDFTYNDGGPSITASVIASGVDHGALGGLLDDDHTQYFKVTGRASEHLVLGTNANIRFDEASAKSVGQGDGFRPQTYFALGSGTSAALSVNKNFTNNAAYHGVNILGSATIEGQILFTYSGSTKYSGWRLNADNLLRLYHDDYGFTASFTHKEFRMDSATGANITWNTDGGGDVGASGANRPGTLFLNSKIQLPEISTPGVSFYPPVNHWNLYVKSDGLPYRQNSAGAEFVIGSSTPGSDTYVIFNDLGNLNGEADFTWNKTLNHLSVTGMYRGPNGSTSAVTFGNSTNTNTGLYFLAADRWGLSGGGVANVYISSDPNLTFVAPLTSDNRTSSFEGTANSNLSVHISNNSSGSQNYRFTVRGSDHGDTNGIFQFQTVGLYSNFGTDKQGNIALGASAASMTGCVALTMKPQGDINTGQVASAAASTTVTGDGGTQKFTIHFGVGDLISVDGGTTYPYTIVSITDNNTMTIHTAATFSGVTLRRRRAIVRVDDRSSTPKFLIKADGEIGTSTTVAATVLAVPGTTVRKLLIYDATGVLLGEIPIYASGSIV